jgi:phosphoribosylformylglycinamidine cyclo-ligase
MTKKKPLSYAASGVDIDEADKAKEVITSVIGGGARVIDAGKWAFASLVDGRFPDCDHPVLVLKTEEPGSKQLLAFQEDKVESICQDMINHLINDIAVMGATPIAIQDCVVCGKLDGAVAARIVKGIAAACKEQDCVLTGGETSEQPGVIPAGTYILSSSVVGIVDKKNIVDGSAIEPGDVVLAVASNGLHTNGYSLVRRLMKENPDLVSKKVDGMSFMDAILLPHMCYFKAIRDLHGDKAVHGMAHITGSGIEGNLERILRPTVDAKIDLTKVEVLPIFSLIREEAGAEDKEMLRTYNMGVGLILVVKAADAGRIQKTIAKHGHACYPIGEIATGSGKVSFAGNVRW